MLPTRLIVVPRPEGKVMAALHRTGRMFAMAAEAVRQAVSHGVPLTELLDQCWFLGRVTTVPLILCRSRSGW